MQQVHPVWELCLGSSVSQFWSCAYTPDIRGLRVRQLSS